jgi:ATP-dependent DNA helicase 2 subunit 1
VKHELEDDVGPPAKKPKIKAQSLEDMSMDDIRKALAAGNLTKYTVADLKDWLSSKGLSTTGTKPVLLERIEQWLEAN